MVLVDDQVPPIFALLPDDVELREDVRPAGNCAAGEAVALGSTRGGRPRTSPLESSRSPVPVVSLLLLLDLPLARRLLACAGGGRRRAAFAGHTGPWRFGALPLAASGSSLSSLAVSFARRSLLAALSSPLRSMVAMRLPKSAMQRMPYLEQSSSVEAMSPAARSPLPRPPSLRWLRFDRGRPPRCPSWRLRRPCARRRGRGSPADPFDGVFRQ